MRRMLAVDPAQRPTSEELEREWAPVARRLAAEKEEEGRRSV